jgi:hypothetical protein
MSLPEAFSYDEPAEVYSTDGKGARKRPVSYRRFASSAEAIRFAVEQLPQIMQRGTVMEVGEERYEFADIRALYESDRYPLQRDCDGEADGTGIPGEGRAG